MNDALALAAAAAAGALLGAFFFGGLWWTVKKGVSSDKPELLFFASLFIRTAVALGGFYLALQSGAYRLIACIAGFIAAHLASNIILFPSEKINLKNEVTDEKPPQDKATNNGDLK
jgi:F1F0 ATPase subunit 2